jgi:adenylyltransferase/sulfurtransferase
VLVDVREDFERAICKIDQATAIRLSELPNQLGSLPSDRLIIFHCKTGVRSESAVNLAQEAGIKNVAHLAGGILAWKEKVAPEMNGY